MFTLKPSVNTVSVCPECASPAAISGMAISGMIAYADCTCQACGVSFFEMLPVGHFVSAPLKVRKPGNHVYNARKDFQWLSRIVTESFPLQTQPVSIRKKVFSGARDVIVLNALDFLYGHSLLKLYNAQYHLDHDRDIGLIIIAPRVLEWMIPEGCCEAWIVDMPLGAFRKGYEAIRQFMDSELKRFDRVFMSPAYSHPDVTSLDIRRFTGIRPFDLAGFDTGEPCITFVLREDRWWFKARVDYWFYRLCRKTGLLKYGNKVLSFRQNALVKQTIRRIRKLYPRATFSVVGLGTTGSFKGIADDFRAATADNEAERAWCHVYAKSQVVIGFHGSNMLLPTAFAAGCVEILPEDRYGNIVQDISVRYVGRAQLFFYRFSDQYCRPRSVASKAIAIIRDYESYHRNMHVNVHKPEKT